LNNFDHDFSLLASEGRAKLRKIKRLETEPVPLNLFRTPRAARAGSTTNPGEDDYDTFNLRSTSTHIKYLEGQLPNRTGREQAFALELPEGYDKYSIPKNKRTIFSERPLSETTF